MANAATASLLAAAEAERDAALQALREREEELEDAAGELAVLARRAGILEDRAAAMGTGGEAEEGRDRDRVRDRVREEEEEEVREVQAAAQVAATALAESRREAELLASQVRVLREEARGREARAARLEGEASELREGLAKERREREAERVEARLALARAAERVEERERERDVEAERERERERIREREALADARDGTARLAEELELEREAAGTREEESAAELGAVRTELDALGDLVRTLRGEVEEARASEAGAREEAGRAEADLAGAEAERARVEERNQFLLEEVGAHRSAIGRIEEDLRGAQGDAARALELQGEVDALRRERAERAAMEEEGTANQVGEAKLEIAALQSSLGRMEREKECLIEAGQALEEGLSEEQRERKAMEGRNAELVIKLEECQCRLAPVGTAVDSSEADASSPLEGDGIAANVKDMEARLRAKEDDIRQLRRHLLDSENEKEECHRQMEEQTDRYTEISSEMLQRIEELEKQDEAETSDNGTAAHSAAITSPRVTIDEAAQSKAEDVSQQLELADEKVRSMEERELSRIDLEGANDRANCLELEILALKESLTRVGSKAECNGENGGFYKEGSSGAVQELRSELCRTQTEYASLLMQTQLELSEATNRADCLELEVSAFKRSLSQSGADSDHGKKQDEDINKDSNAVEHRLNSKEIESKVVINELVRDLEKSKADLFAISDQAQKDLMLANGTIEALELEVAGLKASLSQEPRKDSLGECCETSDPPVQCSEVTDGMANPYNDLEDERKKSASLEEEVSILRDQVEHFRHQIEMTTNAVAQAHADKKSDKIEINQLVQERNTLQEEIGLLNDRGIVRTQLEKLNADFEELEMKRRMLDEENGVIEMTAEAQISPLECLNADLLACYPTIAHEGISTMAPETGNSSIDLEFDVATKDGSEPASGILLQNIRVLRMLRNLVATDSTDDDELGDVLQSLEQLRHGPPCIDSLDISENLLGDKHKHVHDCGGKCPRWNITGEDESILRDLTLSFHRESSSIFDEPTTDILSTSKQLVHSTNKTEGLHFVHGISPTEIEPSTIHDISRPGLTSEHEIVISLQKRCDSLEKERDSLLQEREDLLNETVDLLETSRAEHEAEIEAAVSKARGEAVFEASKHNEDWQLQLEGISHHWLKEFQPERAVDTDTI